MHATAQDAPSLVWEEDVLSCDADIVSGTTVFRGTRVPAVTLFDHLMHGKSLDEFIE